MRGFLLIVGALLIDAPLPPSDSPAIAASPPSKADARIVAQAELSVYPSRREVYVGSVRSSLSGGWLVLGVDFEPIEFQVFDDQKGLIFEAEAGTYAVLFFPPGPITQPQVRKVTLGPDPSPPPPPGPQPTPNANPYPRPKSSILESLDAILAISLEQADAKALSELYAKAAAKIRGSIAARAAGTVPEIGTPAELRGWLVEAGKELGLSKKYAGLSDAVDAFLAKSLGLAADRELTENDADVFVALAWAIWEGGN